MDESEATDENTVCAILQQRLKVGEETLTHLGALPDESNSTHTRLFSQVAIGIAHQLFYFTGKITRDVGRRNISQSRKREASNILKDGEQKDEKGWLVARNYLIRVFEIGLQRVRNKHEYLGNKL
jgi:hypothetical protein